MKTMKKALAVTLVLVMSVVLLTGCGTSKKDDPITGQWKCTSLDMGSGDVLSQFGSTFGDSIVFYAWEDGDSRFSMMGSSFPMKWENKGDDYELTIDLKSFAEASGMTEEEMKAALQGSTSADVEDSQSYKAEVKDGKLVVDMAKYYKDKDKSAASDSSSAKMEFTFERTGDAPDKEKIEKEAKEQAEAMKAASSAEADSSAAAEDQEISADTSAK